MREIVLRADHKTDDVAFTVDLMAIVRDLQRIERQKVKVYRTWVTAFWEDKQDKTYCFVTTSKDVHLRLGMMSHVGRYHLAELLNRELSALNGQSEVMVYEDEKRNGALHVTVQDRTSDGVAFHLSLAH